MAQIADPVFVDTRYGKNYVRLLHVKRQRKIHYIRELEVNTALTLDTKKDYLVGDNSDIVATDSQKNTVYALAKQYGVEGPESFALRLAAHFLNKYSHVNRAQITVEENPWRRIRVDNQEHVHAFISSPEAVHYCYVSQSRGEAPQLSSGIKKLRVMKTTQSAFVNFIRDEYTSLPDAPDRIFCTEINAKWVYNSTVNVDFNQVWEKVRDIILEAFAGPADKGVFSPSVQQTLYTSEKLVLSKIPAIQNVEIELPNIHYYSVDFSKLDELGVNTNNEVFQPSDKPSGNIYAKVTRAPVSKL